MSQNKEGNMQAHVKDILLEIGMGQGTGHENLRMWPLYGGSDPGVEYFSVDEAIDRRLLEITEVSDSGEVPNLQVKNKGERPILILAGEELVGAKQNRLVNTSLLLAGLTAMVMPVSCVEQGRWRSRSKEFGSDKRLSSSQLRARVDRDVQSAIREGRGFTADQAGVWEEISSKMSRMAVASPTMAMNAMYNSYDDQLGRYTESFRPDSRQQGLIMAINGRIAGLELFDAPGSLAKYFDKVLKSYALDAIDLKEEGYASIDTEAQAGNWLAELLEVPIRTRPSLGLGYDIRLENDRTTGAALLYENSVLYLSAFAAPETKKEHQSSLFASLGRRRRM
jgi:hypothetical protein